LISRTTRGSGPHGEYERRIVRVGGVVQGVGFRPFVSRLAASLGVSGSVCNDGRGVVIDATAAPDVLDDLQRGLVELAPPLARVTRVAARKVRPKVASGSVTFEIVESRPSTHAVIALAPDSAVCPACLAEMRDPDDRRYRYPFVTCTECGPRFTITRALPYDRPNTTMAGFALCAECQAEYDSTADRRFHAQPLACPACGPRLSMVDSTGQQVACGDLALTAAQRLLDSGAIVAVKGIGGYQLVCDATNSEAVARLRARKHRGAKPLAVLVAESDVVAPFVSISAAELGALTSPQRPIVLLRRTDRSEDEWPALVAPDAAHLGVMLPCSPVQHLLLDGLGTPAVVCTSGNVAGEPMAIDDDDALERLGNIADAWLVNDRPIHSCCDDSVVRVHDDRVVPLRRSRGFVPLPIDLASSTASVAPTVLAMGGDLKGALCVAAGGQAFMSQHLGDHGQLATYHAARRSVEQLVELAGGTVDRVAIDCHPAYLSSRLGRELAARWRVPVVEVQHHHAHVASLIAESGRSGEVIGIAFDGTGYGTDGTIWGGEVLVATAARAERAAHLRAVALPGGDAAIEHPARSALAHLWAAGVQWNPALPCVAAVSAAEQAIVRSQLGRRCLTVPTSSMGRLFDAVASLAGVRHTVDYEAQAAIELEAVADPAAEGSYAFGPVDAVGAIDSAPVVAAVVRDVLAGVPAAVVAMRFHRAVVGLVADASLSIRAAGGPNIVALTGGVFQNLLLLEGCREVLDGLGFEVLHHQLVPTNDGGLALGQALVARQGA
jgi:hydrogenase maturation protein HypF